VRLPFVGVRDVVVVGEVVAGCKMERDQSSPTAGGGDAGADIDGLVAGGQRVSHFSLMDECSGRGWLVEELLREATGGADSHNSTVKTSLGE
jgi:hypothetical protein